MRPPGTREFSSTQVALPPEIAAHLIAFGKTIPNKELAEDGRETEPHVTIKYGIHGTDPEPVSEAIQGAGAARLKLGKTALFKSPEQEVLIVQIDSPDLHRLNKLVEDSGKYTDTHPGYKPHATIAYLKPGFGKKYEGLDKFAGMEAVIPSVTFSSKDGSRTEIPLEGTDMPKKMAFQRKQARDARKMAPPGDFGSIPAGAIPHEAITDPPQPGATAEMAAGGEDVARGNSSGAPLTPEGRATVAQTGAALAALGGVDQIIGSDSERTRETADAIQGADPKRPPVATDPALESHALGNLEGEPKNGGVKKFLADLVRKYPDYRIPGQGAMTSKPGESFNEFRVRALSAVRGIMQTLAQNPIQSIAVPKHSQVSKLVKAWIAAGLPDDLSVDPKVMTADETVVPGSVEKFAPDMEGNWQLTPFDPAKEQALPKGAIYFIEHGETPATKARSGQISASQRARAQIVTAIREGDWKKAQNAARAANGGKLLTDDEISEAIDEAIPNGDAAESLPPEHLLAHATAASPAKRAALMPLVNQQFRDLSTVSPEGQRALQQHISRL